MSGQLIFTLLLVLFLLPPRPALAQGSSEVQAYLLSVKRLYEDFENESALKQIARAKTLPRTPDEDVTLSLYEGVIQADLNRWAESAAAFKAALSQRPEAQLPVKVSPKVQQHFEKVRQDVKQELAARAKPPEPPPAPPAPPPATKPSPSSPGPIADVGSPPPEVAQRSFTRPQVLIPAITGGVLLVAGGTTWAMSRKELSRLNNDDPDIRTREDAHSTASRGRTLQSVGVGLLGAGAVGLGLAAGWYAFGPASNEMALQVGTDGTSAFVQGRWP
jgi:hypothetical protein